ncbi:hypothetical protein SEVIR_1G204000v4 [Setaria viridis]|uniref:Myb/SANT-like DNA-binding domain-containing protein n=1 Tax=Setaria viridis TaxID=4556 RepID=A0A4U6WAT0_SETVI|nr:trihelix transcription factor ASIL2-like [Setaria viridis]TKW39808.1 hypothetical protein SEVIR_1G204000v2 [Setaria viridis]
MDDDGAASPSPSPSPSPSRSPSPLPVADPVTVAAAPPGHVAVAIPLRKPSPSSGGGGGGGREDAWSDGATSTLIDAWGERFVALGRGSLRHPQWQEVAEVVSSRDGYSKPPKSDVQCKNRIDTLKKKYKIEKSKRGSSWPYFDRLDDLLAPVHKPNSSSSSAAAAARSAPPMVPPRINFPQRTRTPLQPSAGSKRRMPSPPPQASASSESSDGFPPETRSALPNGKRQRVEEHTPAAAANGAESSDSRAQGLRDLAQAIRRLGEVYERVENAKREQEFRMERERLDAARELEDQRAQFFLKMQMELTKATGGGASAAAAPVAVPIPADGNGTRRTGMAAEVATSSNHRVRYRIKGSIHQHATQQPHYQNNATGNGSDSDNKEAEEDAEDEEEESQ